MPIVQGAITTLLGMSGLINAPSESYDIFFQVTADVIVLGLYHGLVVLPVFLLISEDIARFLWGCVDCVKGCCGCGSKSKTGDEEERGGGAEGGRIDGNSSSVPGSGVTFTLTSVGAERRGQSNVAFASEAPGEARRTSSEAL
jgi:hypothetical protein